jgi:hypothetical protein
MHIINIVFFIVFNGFCYTKNLSLFFSMNFSILQAVYGFCMFFCLDAKEPKDQGKRPNRRSGPLCRASPPPV